MGTKFMKFRYMNKFVYLLFFLFLTQQLFAMDPMDRIGIGDIDLSDIDAIDDSEKDNVQRNIDDAELLGAAGTLAEKFNQPIWQNTKAPEGRDILYHIPYKIAAIEYGGIAGNLFFNMTNRMNTSSSSLMGGLQGEQLENLKDVLELFVGDLIGQESQKVLSSVVPVLGKITIQERRLGALIQGGFVKGPFSVQLHTSLQVAERNFYISKKNQKIVRDAFSEYDQGGEFDQNELIYWRFGMGDTRLKIGMNTLNLTDFQNDFGFECIIPTSQLSHSPKIDINPGGIFDDTSNEALQKSITNVLKGMRDYLIDPSLGNGGHFAFGCYMESKADLFHRLLQLWMRVSYDKLFPGDEYRLFMYKVTVTPTDLQNVVKTADVDKVRPVLKSFIQQYLLPTSFKSEIYPGGIFNFVLAASTEIKKMKFAIGYDFYAQQKETIEKIYNTNTSMLDLKVEASQAERVEQHKVFAEGLYVKKYKRCDLGVGLGGDAAIYSQGIGDDWTVYFKISASF